MKRIIGDYGPKDSSTLILAIGGMHGNEPTGTQALEQVFDYLHTTRPAFQGRLLGLRGNLEALKSGRRYIHEDLNRIWSPANIQAARQKVGMRTSPELQQLAELFEILDAIDFNSYQQKVFIDLHTTSAQGSIFVVATEYEQSRFLLDHLQAPIILGLAEKLDHTAIRYLHRQGFISFAFEGGKHQSQASKENLEWALWLSMIRTHCIEEKYVPNVKPTYQRLKSQNAHLPHMLHLEYLHKVHPSDQFRMRPGYQNFDKVRYGEILAEDKNGLIRSEINGYLLMPLYQKEGDDGFFIVKSRERID